MWHHGAGAMIAAVSLLVGACADDPRRSRLAGDDAAAAPLGGANSETVTLAFAGDVHFQLQLAALLERPHGDLGPITRPLSGADLTMVNLESAITRRGRPEAKEREVPSQRFHFRTSPAALDLLTRAGVDIVTMANNHGADYGPQGLADTLRAIRRSPIPVVGVGRNQRAAFTPHRVSVRGVDLAYFGADASFREGASSVWAAGPRNPGIAAAHAARPRLLLDAVRAASNRGDVVVVYLHWGAALRSCPTRQQRITARALADAGADIIVGSHAHVLLGSGWLGDTYVNYGLGNFVWYHDHQPETGILKLRVRDGAVVGDAWTPARIQAFGRPLPLRGVAARSAAADWRRLRSCTGLTAPARPGRADAVPPRTGDALPAYSSSVRRIGPALSVRMRWSHRPGCPVPLADLRHLRMSYVGFDQRVHTGEMIVHEDHAAAVTDVFGRLYAARWPIQRMRLVDAYRGDDELSMAANNTSAYNCRRVAGSQKWSEHAYGAALDLNPVQNPWLTGPSVQPPAGRRFAAIDRSPGTRAPAGAVVADDVVVRAFARIGWEWGGAWSGGEDYQHFSASAR